MEGYPNPYHFHQQMQQQQQMMGAGSGAGAGGSVGVDAGDRFPQWSAQETKEFLMIRAELDRSFMETKRNKVLWEVIASRMKEKGFFRSSDQCKCKWKNLVTRYKGCETMEAEAMRQQQLPFYNELHAIFTARMQRMLWVEAEGGGGAGAAPTTSAPAAAEKKKAATPMSSSEEVEIDEDSDGENIKNVITTPAGPSSSGRNKRKKAKGRGGPAATLREVVEEYMTRQVEMEVQWREAWEAREEERRRREEEWRRGMEALEKERLAMERSWREREEQRRVREEARAEKRDALITALLSRLTGDPS